MCSIHICCNTNRHSLNFAIVCDNLERYSSASPFLCMDLCYITALLKEGFGFGDSTVLQVSEIRWSKPWLM